MEMDFSFENMFTADERELFKNKQPTSEDVRRLKEINRNIKLAVKEDTVEGYLRAHKLKQAKDLLIGNDT